MRLTSLYLRNFRGFEEREFSLNPSFNLVIGENGAGKTSFLEAAAVAIGSWLLGFRGYDSRHIRDEDVRRRIESFGTQVRSLPQYPVIVAATARFDNGEPSARGGTSLDLPNVVEMAWERSLTGKGGRTTQVGARQLKQYAARCSYMVLNAEQVTLPLIRYFGAGRLWEPVRNAAQKAKPNISERDEQFEAHTPSLEEMQSPFFGYRLSVDKRCNPDNLIQWIAHERRIEIDEGITSILLQSVMSAIGTMLPGEPVVQYSVRLQNLLLHANGQATTFSDLSDGYRNVIAIAADLAIKSVMLNPHLGGDVLAKTPGVVLIDELDLHLHPRWQRAVIEQLRQTFPMMQFICTTHSPFLIQTLRSDQELIVLDGKSTADLGHLGIEAIAAGIMGVDWPEASPRYIAMLDAARTYLQELDVLSKSPDDRLDEYKEQLATHIAPFAENPAFQAVLEAERRAAFGR